jgi:hypothetical protein
LRDARDLLVLRARAVEPDRVRAELLADLVRLFVPPRERAAPLLGARVAMIPTVTSMSAGLT